MSREDLLKLARHHGPDCISIYLPTARAGEEVDQKHAQIRLKNILKELEEAINDRGSSEQLKSSLQQIREIREDDLFFRHQSDGMAIFISSGKVWTFTMPVRFEQRWYLSDHFYLLSLFPYFNDNGIFYLLALSLQQISLYDCTRHSVSEVNLEEAAPQSLEEVVGADYEEKSLQYRTSGSSGGGNPDVTYHGQGSGKDDRDKETEKFFREVDHAITSILENEEAPLVLACVDHYLPLYREITGYRHLFSGHIPGNPDETDPLVLQEKGWSLVEEHFTGNRRDKRELIRSLSATGKASYETGEIIAAAVDGRIDTLFVQKGKDLYGIYDLEKRLIRENPDREREVSLFNMAATHTLLNGGEVFTETPDQMPFRDSELSALFRYEI